MQYSSRSHSRGTPQHRWLGISKQAGGGVELLSACGTIGICLLVLCAASRMLCCGAYCEMCKGGPLDQHQHVWGGGLMSDTWSGYVRLSNDVGTTVFHDSVSAGWCNFAGPVEGWYLLAPKRQRAQTY
jgi:hypothetical protein